MFDLWIKKNLVEMIERICVDEIDVYVKSLEQTAADEADDSELRYILPFRKYCEAIYNRAVTSIENCNTRVKTRARDATLTPAIAGLPDEFTFNYIDVNGVFPGITYAICYYAITGRQAQSTKDYRTMSMLNHFQNALINNEIDRIEDNIIDRIKDNN